MPSYQPRHPIPDQPTPVSLGVRPRILVVKLAGLGDVLLTTPALRALRARYPNGRIDLLVTREAAPLLRDSPLVDRVITLDKYAYDRPAQVLRHPTRLARVIRPLAALRVARYDAVLLMHHLTLPFGRLKYRALLAVVAPRLMVGLDNGHGGYFDVRVPDYGFGTAHEAEYALAVAAAVDATLPAGQRGLRLADLGWDEGTSNAENAKSAEDRSEDQTAYTTKGVEEGARVTTEQATSSTGRQYPMSLRASASCVVDRVPLVAMHVGGGGYSLARRWPVERFAEVAAALHDEWGAHVVLVGGAEEQALHAELLARLGKPKWAESLAGQTEPRALAGLLAQCALFVGNDSLPMHLAAAAGIPVAAIFGPSNARAWGPYVPDAPHRAAIVRRDLACSPCFYRGHQLGTPQGCPPRPCLTELPATAVLAASRRLLRRTGAAAAPAG